MKPLDPARFELAVTALALYRAKTAVIAQIRADGLKLGQFSSREINEKRDAYFAAHMEELITKAAADVWRFPEFARYRQQQTQQQSDRRAAGEALADIARSYAVSHSTISRLV